jgi:hypothetical protein
MEQDSGQCAHESSAFGVWQSIVRTRLSTGQSPYLALARGDSKTRVEVVMICWDAGPDMISRVEGAPTMIWHRVADTSDA